MTKSQLIERIAEKAPHLNPRQLEAVVNAVFDQMTQALKAGERIELRGFGCFGVKTRPARLGRNPKTGASVALPRRFAVTFAAGKELRERINHASSPPEPVTYVPVRLPSASVQGTSALAPSPGVVGEVAPRI